MGDSELAAFRRLQAEVFRTGSIHFLEDFMKLEVITDVEWPDWEQHGWRNIRVYENAGGIGRLSEDFMEVLETQRKGVISTFDRHRLALGRISVAPEWDGKVHPVGSYKCLFYNIGFAPGGDPEFVDRRETVEQELFLNGYQRLIKTRDGARVRVLNFLQWKTDELKLSEPAGLNAGEQPKASRIPKPPISKRKRRRK